jgi:hypothetical protein
LGAKIKARFYGVEKMTNERRLSISYDDIADVLYICAGNLSHTKNTEEEAGLVLRYDAATHFPVGATVIDYKEYWLPKRQTLVRKLAQFFESDGQEADRALPH